MKILWISHESSLSGANKCLISLIKGLKAHNIQSSLITNNFGPLIKEIDSFCYRIYFEKYKWWTYNGNSYWLKLYFIRNFFRVFISIWDIYKVIKLEKPNIVITNTGVICVGAFAAWLARKTHFWYIHEFGKEDHNFKYQYGRRFSFFLIGFLSKKVITVSNVLKNYLTELSINKDKIKVIYNGIEIPNFKKNRIKKENTLRIISIGRIAKGKNIEIAIRAVHKLKILGYTNIDLSIYGGINDADYYNYLRSEVVNLNIQNQIHFKGYTLKPLEEIHNSDIILINSHSEAFGRTTIEAMVCKTLVIANNKGANVEIINNGTNGFLYESGNTDELVNRIIYSIDYPEKIKVVINNAFHHSIKNYSEEAYILNFYNEIINLSNEL